MPRRLVLEALRSSLFTVAPSIWSDPFPLVALEAAAAGKPTIASRIGGLQDSVVDGETGFLVPPGDRGALVTAMRRLVDDAELRERMGAAAAPVGRRCIPRTRSSRNTNRPTNSRSSSAG